MKNLFFTAIAVLLISVVEMIPNQVCAQWTDTGTTIYTNDFVGIGTQVTDNNLLSLVANSIPSLKVQSTAGTYLQIGVPTYPGAFSPFSVLGDVVLRAGGAVNGHSAILFHIPNDNMDGQSYFSFGDEGNGHWLKIFNNKEVKMDGKLYAKEIEVKSNVWADYVFEPNYHLMPIDELEFFIKQNNHLPNIPTEAEVKSNGINVAEINAKLLQKVEELTLYLIEQQKQINELKENLK